MKATTLFDSLEELVRAFSGVTDLSEKAIIASRIWREHGKTFTEIDLMLGLYTNWCCKYMWRSRLSKDAASVLRKGLLSVKNAELLSFLPTEKQDEMMRIIEEQGLNLKRSTGVRALLVRCVEGYDELVARQVNENRSVVPLSRVEGKKEISKTLPNTSNGPQSLADVPWYIRSIHELLASIEGLPLEDLGENHLSPADILELGKLSNSSSSTASKIASRLRIAWQRRLAKNAPVDTIAI